MSIVAVCCTVLYSVLQCTVCCSIQQVQKFVV